MRYSDAIWRPSSCFSPGKGRKPSFVVLHITDGSPSVQNAAERFAASKAGVSPHFLVGQAGSDRGSGSAATCENDGDAGQ